MPDADDDAQRSAQALASTNGSSARERASRGQAASGDAPSFMKRAVMASVALVGVAMAGYLVLTLSTTLLVLYGGVLLAVALHGASQSLARGTGLPRQVALLALLGAFVGLGAGVYMLAPSGLGAQLTALTEQIPTALRQIRTALRESALGRLLPARALSGQGALLPEPSAYLGGVAGVFSTTVGGLANLAILAIVGLYGAAWPSTYTRGFLLLFEPTRRTRLRQVMYVLARALQWWFVGRLTSMTILGTLTTLGLWAMGMKAALPLGVLAGLLSFVPYLGPVFSAVPAILAATLDGGTAVISVVLLYAGIQFIESYLITPLVQEHAVSIPPVVLIAAQAIMGVLSGILGVLVATPLAVTIIVLVQTMYVEERLGDDVHVLGEQGGDEG